MSRARTQGYAWWQCEAAFIAVTADTRDFESFNNDSACFARYCEMQAAGADREGFTKLAAQIRAAAIRGAR